MTRLVIISHAATDAVRAARFPADEDIADPAGVARSLTARLVASRWLSGPERRTVATAAALGAPGSVTVDPALRDWDCGRWRGRDLPGIQQSDPLDLQAWMSDPAAAPHGGESLLALLDRVGDWLDRQAAERGKTIAVSHPAILRGAIVKALEAGPAAFWRIDARPLCRVQLAHDGRRWVLQGLTRPRTAA